MTVFLCFIQVDLEEMRVMSTMSLHRDEIRDVKFSPANDGMVLTASKDKQLKLSSLYSNTVVHR